MPASGSQPLLAALAALSIVWFSAAQLNVMFPFLINFSLPLAATVAIWIVLDRDTWRGDVAAGVFLAVALASSGIGLVTFVAVAAELLARRAPTRRWLPFVPPLVLWVVWYAGYHTKIQSGSVGGTVRYALHEVVATFAGFVGGWNPGGYVLLVATAVVFVLAIVRWRTFTARAAGALAGFAAFVALTAYSRIGIVPAIPADTGRYIWLNGFFVVVALLEVARGSARSPLVLVAGTLIVVLGAVTLVGNLRDYTQEVAQNERSTRTFIVATQAISDHIDRSRIIRPFSYIPVRVGQYLAAVEQLGSPLRQVSLADLGTETERATADRWMVEDLGLRLEPVMSAPSGVCAAVPPSTAGQDLAVRGARDHRARGGRRSGPGVAAPTGPPLRDRGRHGRPGRHRDVAHPSRPLVAALACPGDRTHRVDHDVSVTGRQRRLSVAAPACGAPAARQAGSSPS